MLARQDGDALCEADADERVAALEKRITELRSAARRRDYGPIERELGEAAGTVAIELPAPVPSSLGRRAAGLLRELAEAEIATEDGEGRCCRICARGATSPFPAGFRPRGRSRRCRGQRSGS